VKLKIGEIVINGLIIEIFEGIEREGKPYPKGHWMGEQIYIYDGLSDAADNEITAVLDYLYEEGFIQDRRTSFTVIRADDFEEE
jgi:hypothetical protein